MKLYELNTNAFAKAVAKTQGEPALPSSPGYYSHFEFEDVEPDYDRLRQDPSTEWMPDMNYDEETQDPPTYKVSVRYETEAASRGARERGTGLALEPDYSAQARVTDAFVLDKGRWIPIKDIDKIFGRGSTDKFEQDINDSLQ